MAVNDMAESGHSRANTNRAIRQEALREQLASQKHVEHVVEISNKLADLDTDIDGLKVQRLKAAADLKIKLIAKYLPDTKQLEVMGEGGGPVATTFNFVPVNSKTK